LIAEVASAFLCSDLNPAPSAAEKLYSGSLEGRAFILEINVRKVARIKPRVAS
jgi:hypothetical protein